MRSILLNKSICSTRFIRLANEVGFARRNRPENSPNIQTAYSVWLFSEEINSGRTEMQSAEELLALRTALPSSARALTFPHQNALHCLRKQSLLRLRFQTHREQGILRPSNCIIKSRAESLRQLWSTNDRNQSASFVFILSMLSSMWWWMYWVLVRNILRWQFSAWDRQT